MDDQTAFDKMIQHCFDQGTQSRRARGPGSALTICAYRGEGGRSCAVGCLIPDSEYCVDFEGKPIGGIAVDVPSLARLSLGMLVEVQTLHDCFLPSNGDETGNVEVFLKEAFKTAVVLGLDPSVPKRLLATQRGGPQWGAAMEEE